MHATTARQGHDGPQYGSTHASVLNMHLWPFLSCVSPSPLSDAHARACNAEERLDSLVYASTSRPGERRGREHRGGARLDACCRLWASSRSTVSMSRLFVTLQLHELLCHLVPPVRFVCREAECCAGTQPMSCHRKSTVIQLQPPAAKGLCSMPCWQLTFWDDRYMGKANPRGPVEGKFSDHVVANFGYHSAGFPMVTIPIKVSYLLWPAHGISRRE